MKIESLREFLYLSEELNFSSTAKHFYISQPVLSKHIQELEKEIGGKLFVRDQRRVELTQCGLLLIEEAQKIICAHDDALERIRCLNVGAAPVMQVGYVYGAAKRLLPIAMDIFKSKNPDVQLDLYTLEVRNLKDAVLKGDVDLGIGIKTRHDDESALVCDPIYEDSMMIMTDIGSELSSRDSITCNDILDMPIVSGNPKTMPEIAHFLHKQLRGTGIEHNLIETLNDGDFITATMHMNDCVAFTMGHLVDHYGPLFRLLPLEDVDLELEVAMFWKKENETTLLKDFAHSVHEAHSIIE